RQRIATRFDRAAAIDRRTRSTPNQAPVPIPARVPRPAACARSRAVVYSSCRYVVGPESARLGVRHTGTRPPPEASATGTAALDFVHVREDESAAFCADFLH